MSFNSEEFIKGIRSGQIRPSKVETKIDKYGQPLTVYDFPGYECQIHAHFTDQEREVVAPSHIMPYSHDDKQVIPIDNYTLAMLRHYAEEAGSLRSEQATISPTPKTIKWLLVLGIVCGIFTILLIKKDETSIKKPEYVGYFITVKQTLDLDGCTFEPGKKYSISSSGNEPTTVMNAVGKHGYLVWYNRGEHLRIVFLPVDEVEEIYSE